MSIIEKVTIKYFRSLHTVDIKQCRNINVITGRNDVGKSNVIKALNLFFNNQADWDTLHDFYENFSKKRLSEVRGDSIKGKQFISIKVHFNRPSNYKGSLPEKFSVERKWLRESKTWVQSDDLSTLHNKNKLPAKLVSAQQSLAKFLNKIHFEYIPAIRDRAYVDNLLSRLQNALLDSSINQNENLHKTAITLAEHIEGQIGELQQDFEGATKIRTSITPPTTMSSLFQSFLVSTNTDDGSVALKYRGDGLQSRYIASVLHYIALNNNDFYIWGYEEPEIALEYSHVTSLAHDIKYKYSKNAQVFISTHSPAFISLSGEDVSCYRVSQENSQSIVANINLSKDVAGKEKLKEELGVLDIQKEVHELYSSKLQKLNKLNVRIKELENELSAQKNPLIVTEGKTDSKILNIAFDKLGVDDNRFSIRACDNSDGGDSSGGASQLAKLIETIHPDDERMVIALFDNDDEGQREFSKLSRNFKEHKDISGVRYHKNGYALAVLLPEPDFRAGYVDAKNLCIEYMFKDEVLEMPFHNGNKLELKNTNHPLSIGGHKLRLEKIPDELLKHIYAQSSCLKKIGSGKVNFVSDVVSELDSFHFEAFKKLVLIFEMIAYPGLNKVESKTEISTIQELN